LKALMDVNLEKTAWIETGQEPSKTRIKLDSENNWRPQSWRPFRKRVQVVAERQEVCSGDYLTSTGGPTTGRRKRKPTEKACQERCYTRIPEQTDVLEKRVQQQHKWPRPKWALYLGSKKTLHEVIRQTLELEKQS
jgi:hypothetical protein